MAATAPLVLPLLLLSLSVGVAPATSSNSTHCHPSPALLLVSKVTELARTALTAEPRSEQQIGVISEWLDGAAPRQHQQHQQHQHGRFPFSGTNHKTSAPSAALLRCLEAVDKLNSRVSRPSGGKGPSDQAQPSTCLELQRTDGSLPDGVYQLAALDDPVYCDFSHDGGGWTLLLTAASRDGWDALNIRRRNTGKPSLTENYSILGRGDVLKTFGTGRRFAYRLEGLAQVRRQQWGGIWLAPRDYTFTPETDTQRDIALVRKFSKWTYSPTTLQRTMPWINVEEYKQGVPLLTTARKASNRYWGTLVTDPKTPIHKHSPWIHPHGLQSGTILYWMREEVLH